MNPKREKKITFGVSTTETFLKKIDDFIGGRVNRSAYLCGLAHDDMEKAGKKRKRKA